MPTTPRSPALSDLAGRTALVTGATGGLGLETARALAQRGARVLVGARDVGRGDAAVDAVRRSAPEAEVERVHLDLADLASVEMAAKDVGHRVERLDLLVNNAGVMATPYRVTVDGSELQLGTNHLGHFALTGHLLGLLAAAEAPRVVTVSSGVAAGGRIDLDDLDGRRRYDRWRAYAQSKLANLLFTVELQRRVDAAGSPLLAVAAHPGWAATGLQAAGPRMSGSRIGEVLSNLGNRLFAQDAAAGARPIVHAAAADDVRGADYWGPDGFGGWRGAPTRVRMPAAAYDAVVARELWARSEERVGVTVAVGLTRRV